MNTPKVKTGFSKLKDDDLGTSAQHILDSLTGNPSYPSPLPPLASISTALDAYHTALAAAVPGGLERTNIKNQKRDALEKLLEALALYVQQNCDADMAVLLSSGFEARKTSEPVGVLKKPENLRAEYGPGSGALVLSIHKIAGAKSYRWEYVLHPATDQTVWNVLNSTARSITITSLQRRQQYDVRVAGIGSNDTLVYSDIISKYTE
jgi:hypothetical protein